MPLRTTAILAAPVIALALAPAPAEASPAVVNPYTPAEACANDFEAYLFIEGESRWRVDPGGGRDSFGNGGC
jgi:hypothetical protein